MAKIKVAILIPGYSLFGQERALLSIAKTLKDDDIEVICFTHHEFGKNSLNGSVQEMGFRVVSLPMNTIWSPTLLLRKPREIWHNIKGMVQSSKIMSDLVRRENIDLFITGNWSFAFYLLPALKRLAISFIYRHGDAPPTSNILSRRIARAVFNRANVHIANCDFVRQKLLDFKLQRDVDIIRNLVEIPEKIPDLTPGNNCGVTRLLYAGQMSPHKGVNVLLDAFDLLAEQSPELQLLLAGSIPGVNNFETNPTISRVREGQLRWGERVKYVGHVSNISELFTDSTLHICPSIWDDPSPNVIFEAKVHAAPTIAFYRGGIPELVTNGVDGFIVKNETPEALAEEIRKLVMDKTLFSQAKLAARQSINEILQTSGNQQWPQLVRKLVVPAK